MQDVHRCPGTKQNDKDALGKDNDADTSHTAGAGRAQVPNYRPLFCSPQLVGRLLGIHDPKGQL